MKKENIGSVLDMIAKSGITVNGDLVLEKNVDYEVANVEPGGIGIQINRGEECPMTVAGESVSIQQENHLDGIPSELQKKGVIANLEKLQSQGLLDEDFRPVSGKLQVNQLAAIANKIGKAYNIRNYWKAFGALWGIDKGNLRSSFAQLSMDSIGQKEFSEKILSHIN